MFKELFNCGDIDAISTLFEKLIPEGTDTEVDTGDIKIKVYKKDGVLKVDAVVDNDGSCVKHKCEKPHIEKKFDDHDIKHKVKSFKLAIEHLDDDVFVNFIEYLGEEFDINTMCKLIDLEHYTEVEACKTLEYITKFTKEFADYINNYKALLSAELNEYIKALKK